MSIPAHSFSTQDGTRLPLPRHLMTDPDAIARRMAEDMAEVECFGAVSTTQLLALGWTYQQVSRHGRAASRRHGEASRRAA